MSEEKTEANFELLSDKEIELLDVEEEQTSNDFAISEIATKIQSEGLPKSLPMFLRLTRRAVVFFFCMLVSLIVLFVVGNFQHFVDSNQRLLLFFCTIDAIMLLFFSAFAFVESIVCIFIEGRIRYAFYALFFLIPFVFALIFALLSRSLLLLSEGFSI